MTDDTRTWCWSDLDGDHVNGPYDSREEAIGYAADAPRQTQLEFWTPPVLWNGAEPISDWESAEE